MKINISLLLLGTTLPQATKAGFVRVSTTIRARHHASRRFSSVATAAHRGGESGERMHHVESTTSATSSGYAPKSRSGRPWRRVISKVFLNRGKDGAAAELTIDKINMRPRNRIENDSRFISSSSMNDTTTFLLRSFQELSPSDVFGDGGLAQSTFEQENDFADLMNHDSQTKKRISIEETSSLPILINDERQSSLSSSLHRSSTVLSSSVNSVPLLVDNIKDYEGGSLLTRVARLWFQNVLQGLMCRWAVEPPEGLRVRVAPRGNVLGRLLVRGQLRLNAEIDFDRVVFPNICLSGGTIAAQRMTLNLWSFAPDLVRFSIPRYQSQFELSATNCTFTQADLLKSSCIRNGLRNLLIRILKARGVRPSEVLVDSLDILPSGKLSCRGKANSLFGSPIHFEVRSGISLASRGHVLTFPGLEISLGNPYLFMPVVPELDLDIGHNARIRDILIDGRQRLVRVTASATICPKHTIKLSQYIQSTDAYSALFSVDVGKWLTRIGNFTQ